MKRDWLEVANGRHVRRSSIVAVTVDRPPVRSVNFHLSTRHVWNVRPSDLTAEARDFLHEIGLSSEALAAAAEDENGPPIAWLGT